MWGLFGRLHGKHCSVFLTTAVRHYQCCHWNYTCCSFFTFLISLSGKCIHHGTLFLIPNGIFFWVLKIVIPSCPVPMIEKYQRN